MRTQLKDDLTFLLGLVVVVWAVLMPILFFMWLSGAFGCAN